MKPVTTTKVFPTQLPVPGEPHTPNTAYGTITLFPNGVILSNYFQGDAITIGIELTANLLQVPKERVILVAGPIRDFYDASMVFTTKFHAKQWLQILEGYA